MSKCPFDGLKDLLPGIEDFICKQLASENLSAFAEKKRQYFVERLDILKLPPTLPPRPPGDIQDERNRSLDSARNVNGDFLAKQREFSRSQSSHTLPVAKSPSPLESEDFYDDVEPEADVLAQNGIPVSEAVVDNEEDLYEVPLSLDNQDGYSCDDMSDDSFTSYESYDDMDPEEGGVEVPGAAIPHPEIQLPRVRTKKKKKRSAGKDTSHHIPISTLPNVTYCSDLYQKGMITWTKRQCAISDNKLYVYKIEKDYKPSMVLSLVGYDILYFEKDGKRNHALRVSHPGCETHWFATDTKSNADIWLEHMTNAAHVLDNNSLAVTQPLSGPSLSSENISSPTEQSQPSLGGSTSPSRSLTNISMSSSPSEGGSGDGIVKYMRNQQGTDIKDYDTKRDLKSPKIKSDDKSMTLGQSLETSMKSMKNFLGTLGRKKGRKASTTIQDVFETVEIDMEKDPTVKIQGYLNVSSPLSFDKGWLRKWCVVSDENFDVYRSHEEKSANENPEFSFPLVGCEINTAMETKRELAFKLEQDGCLKAVLEASDAMDQGRWVGLLIKETKCADRDYSYADSSFSKTHNTTPGDDEQLYENVAPPVPTSSPPVMTPISDDSSKKHESYPSDDLYDDTDRYSPDNTGELSIEITEGSTGSRERENHEITASLGPDTASSTNSPNFAQSVFKSIMKIDMQGANKEYDDNSSNTTCKNGHGDNGVFTENDDIEYTEFDGEPNDNNEEVTNGSSSGRENGVTSRYAHSLSVDGGINPEDSANTTSPVAVSKLDPNKVEKFSKFVSALDKSNNSPTTNSPAPLSSRRSLYAVEKFGGSNPGKEGEDIDDLQDEPRIKARINSLKMKIGQIKRKRAGVRDKKMASRKPSEKQLLDKEFKQLDMEFMETDKQLIILENRLEKIPKNPKSKKFCQPTEVRNMDSNNNNPILKDVNLNNTALYYGELEEGQIIDSASLGFLQNSTTDFGNSAYNMPSHTNTSGSLDKHAKEVLLQSDFNPDLHDPRLAKASDSRLFPRGNEVQDTFSNKHQNPMSHMRPGGDCLQSDKLNSIGFNSTNIQASKKLLKKQRDLQRSKEPLNEPQVYQQTGSGLVQDIIKGLTPTLEMIASNKQLDIELLGQPENRNRSSQRRSQQRRKTS
ncbi:unnamed protein product [Owenia fusiformis]|uniref:PH domain-containing protein n=1 Tax=Owenia fusiformis TaxID=6347 RepID=A0A8S4MYM8_OWEFU|nr:unnamed protein product [Owenia fusiformis]